MKVDLLLHEKEFNALKNFVQDSDLLAIKNNDCIDYSIEKDTIIVGDLIPEWLDFTVNSPEIELKKLEKLENGYMLITIDELKKLLSLIK